MIELAHLGLDAHAPVTGARELVGAVTGTLREIVDDFTRQTIARVVDQAAGNWAEAARRLGLRRGNLHRLATRLGLRAEG